MVISRELFISSQSHISVFTVILKSLKFPVSSLGVIDISRLRCFDPPRSHSQGSTSSTGDMVLEKKSSGELYLDEISV